MSELYHDMQRPFLIGTEQHDMRIHIQAIPRAQYDAIPQKDPLTLYVINETGDVYKGDVPMMTRKPAIDPKAYLHVKKTGNRVTYCISEYDPGTARMITICEYDDANAALDYLVRKTATVDQDEVEYLIWYALNVARHNPAPLYTTVVSVIAAYLGPVRASSVLQRLLVILINIPDARTPYKITDEHRAGKTLADVWEYQLYSEIYNFIERNCLYERRIERAEDEEAWLHQLANELHAKLLEKFSISTR